MEEWSIIVEVTRVINTDDPRIGAIRKLAIDRWSTIEVKEANERQQEEQRLSAEIKSRTVVVTASTLYNDYEENTIRADSKYQGKIIELEGFVDSVDKDIISNGILLLIKSPNQFLSIQVDLYNSDIERAANLKRNQKVVVRCYEIKYRIVPILSDCALI